MNLGQGGETRGLRTAARPTRDDGDRSYSRVCGRGQLHANIRPGLSGLLAMVSSKGAGTISCVDLTARISGRVVDVSQPSDFRLTFYPGFSSLRS